MEIKLRPRVVGLNKKGSVLLLAVWTVVMLSLFSVTIGDLVRQRILVYNRIAQRDRLRSAAESVSKKVMRDFGVGESNSASQTGNETGAVFSNSGTVQIADVEVLYKVFDENRKININKTDFFVLKNLFCFAANLTEESAGRLAASVIDYTDPDDAILTYFDKGSEIDSYAESGFSYGPKNAPFELISELLFVKGMTPQIYASVRDLITVYGNGGLNINTADRQALLYAGLYPTLADKIVQIRKGTTDKTGKMRENFVFNGMSNLLSDIYSFYNLTDFERTSLFQAAALNRLTTTADCYRMEIEAKINHKNISSTVACIFSPRNGVYYWLES